MSDPAVPLPQSQATRLARKTQSLDILYEVAASLNQAGSLEQQIGAFLDVLIEDDGLGMAGPEEPMPAEHAGLAIMRERTGRLPGQIVIESEPGEGTRIVLIFNAPPVAAPAAPGG